ncbi:MAG: hypothetical protein NTV05_08370 [Acidobacteria bacterium]|nr:hypothetical protein [Acidobacteriota bacterium]
MNIKYFPNPLSVGAFSANQSRPTPDPAAVIALTTARKATVDARIVSLTAELEAACAAAMADELRIGSGASAGADIGRLTNELTEAEGQSAFYTMALTGLGE